MVPATVLIFLSSTVYASPKINGIIIAKPIITCTDRIQVAQHRPPGAHRGRVSLSIQTFVRRRSAPALPFWIRIMCPDNYV